MILVDVLHLKYFIDAHEVELDTILLYTNIYYYESKYLCFAESNCLRTYVSTCGIPAP